MSERKSYGADDSPRPHIERTPFDTISPPARIKRYFCPACGREIVGSYSLDYARKRCTRTWHLAEPVAATYVREGGNDDA